MPLRIEVRIFAHGASRLVDAINEAGANEVARRTGISKAQMSYWLNGKRGMKLELVKKIAGSIGLELTYDGKTIKIEYRPPEAD